jgi:hypothetical protein
MRAPECQHGLRAKEPDVRIPAGTPKEPESVLRDARYPLGGRRVPRLWLAFQHFGPGCELAAAGADQQRWCTGSLWSRGLDRTPTLRTGHKHGCSVSGTVACHPTLVPDRASIFCAWRRCGMSSIRPSRANAATPGFCANRSTTRWAWASSSALGVKHSLMITTWFG